MGVQTSAFGDLRAGGINCMCPAVFVLDTHETPHTTVTFENYQKNIENFPGAPDSNWEQARETRVKMKIIRIS